ncbi:MAG: IS4 family transposase [Bacteroidota bacterium]
MGTGLSKSNLAYANENLDWHIFTDYAYILIAEAGKICTSNNYFQLEIEGNVYAVDSTTVDLCLNVFWWAKFRKNKAAVKIHTQYDVKNDIPSYINITDGSVHDVNFMDIMEYESGAYYVMDKGYVDFGRLYAIHDQNAFFITRLKDNTNYRRIYSAKVNKSTGVLCDQTIKLNNYIAAKKHPGKLRRIKYYDEIICMTLEFVTNNFLLPALDIARLYSIVGV